MLWMLKMETLKEGMVQIGKIVNFSCTVKVIVKEEASALDCPFWYLSQLMKMKRMVPMMLMVMVMMMVMTKMVMVMKMVPMIKAGDQT